MQNHKCSKCGDTHFSLHGKCLKCGFPMYTKKEVANEKPLSTSTTQEPLS